ncbi:MAG: DUF1990 domain-containing protein [Actinomycetota bacterium]|jgi:hypothetical protein|nr:DUF1990 domain-containing protein [Actinomycetota bacterium]
MTDQTSRPQEHTEEGRPRDDAAHWARYVETLEVPDGGISPNVEGHRPVGPLQGFGQMWQKTFKVRLEGASASPAEVVEIWRERFPEISGFGRGFRAPSDGLVPGAVALLGGGLTGVMVLYADEESFTYMTPEGHPFSGWITFSAYGDEDGTTVTQIQILIRANDPLWEAMMPLGLNRGEDMQWRGTLRNVAAHFGAKGEVETRVVCVDPKRLWRHYKNVRHNILIRSALRAPMALARKISGRARR